MSQRKRGVERPPPRLFTLTERQERRLREARDTDGGAFSGLCAGPEDGELVDGGAAEYRANVTREHRAAWAGHWEAGEYDRTEYVLQPTAHGLSLLADSDDRAAADRAISLAMNACTPTPNKVQHNNPSFCSLGGWGWIKIQTLGLLGRCKP